MAAGEHLRYIPYKDASYTQKRYIDADGGSAKVETNNLKVTNWNRVVTTDGKYEFEHIVLETVSAEGVRTERDGVRMIVRDAVADYGVRWNPHTQEWEYLRSNEIRPLSRYQGQDDKTSIPQGHMLQEPELFETPEEAALREFYEETGIEGKSALILGSVDRDPSITDAIVHFAVVYCDFEEDVVSESIHQEHTESITVSGWKPIKSIYQDIMKNPPRNPWILAGIPFLMDWHQKQIEETNP